jgi:WD40 repeat protein
MLGRPREKVRQVGYVPGGNGVITAYETGRVRVWSGEGEELADFSAHTGAVLGLDTPASGDLFVTASEDGLACVWSLAGKRLGICRGHEGAVVGVRFTPDGKRFVTWGEDLVPRLWDTDGNELATFGPRFPPTDRPSSPGRGRATSGPSA